MVLFMFFIFSFGTALYNEFVILRALFNPASRVDNSSIKRVDWWSGVGLRRRGGVRSEYLFWKTKSAKEATMTK
jgi:hypothetical protein